MTTETDFPNGLPFRPRDWVAQKGDHSKVAKVRDVYRDDEGVVFLDLWIYSKDGDKIGRDSPPLGGPRNFEPACNAENWDRIKEPRFPITLKWVEGADGRRTAQYIAGEILPSANWTPKPRKPRSDPLVNPYDEMRKTLEAIADGHNDPRALAKAVLGRT